MPLTNLKIKITKSKNKGKRTSEREKETDKGTGDRLRYQCLSRGVSHALCKSKNLNI